MMPDATPLEKKAFRIDTFRQAVDGTFEPYIESVFLIVAIRYFAVGDAWLGLIAASKFIGFLLTAPLIGALNRSNLRRATILAALTAVAAAALGVGSLATTGTLFALAVTLATAAVSLRQPFFTDLYGDLYPPERRARRISPGLRIMMLGSVASGLVYGQLMDRRLDNWRRVLLVGLVAMAAAALALRELPQTPRRPRDEGWWQALAIPFRNPVFLYMQAAWMIIGFGNLWTLPLRAVYLTDVERGLGLSPAVVTGILVIIPTVVRFACNPLWARLYHRLSIPVLRIAINAFFMTSIPLFFLTGRLWVIIAAVVLFGIGTSGSPFIWQLWVTRIASPERTRIYQSAHAFLAGARGVLAPFVGFAVLQGLSFRSMGLISGGLVLTSALMMVPLMRRGHSF